MKTLKTLCLSVVMLSSIIKAAAQKTVTEGTIVYSIAIQTDNNDPKAIGNLNGATTTIYLKGPLSRTDMSSTLGTESTILDSKTGGAIILKEYSGQKLMITLTKDNWIEKNKRFDGVIFTETGETKTIAGYNCKKTIAKLSDGSSSFAVYYTPEIVTANKDYNVTFKNLPGLPVEYEYITGKTKYTYTLSKIGFEALPASKFDAPKTGYRVMTYEENKQIKKGE